MERGGRVTTQYRDPHPRREADPAKGARVLRCPVCGCPRRPCDVIEGRWQGAIVAFPVCAHCIDSFIVRDPLSA